MSEAKYIPEVGDLVTFYSWYREEDLTGEVTYVDEASRMARIRVEGDDTEFVRSFDTIRPTHPFPEGWTSIGFVDETRGPDHSSYEEWTRLDLIESVDQLRDEVTELREIQAATVERAEQAESSLKHAKKLIESLDADAEKADEDLTNAREMQAAWQARAEQAEEALSECSEYFAVKADRDGWKGRAEQAEADLESLAVERNELAAMFRHEMDRVDELTVENRKLQDQLSQASSELCGWIDAAQKSSESTIDLEIDRNAWRDQALANAARMGEMGEEIRELKAAVARLTVPTQLPEPAPRKPRVLRDRDGDLWDEQPDGRFLMRNAEGVPYPYAEDDIVRMHGPVGLIEG